MRCFARYLSIRNHAYFSRVDYCICNLALRFIGFNRCGSNFSGSASDFFQTFCGGLPHRFVGVGFRGFLEHGCDIGIARPARMAQYA